MKKNRKASAVTIIWEKSRTAKNRIVKLFAEKKNTKNILFENWEEFYICDQLKKSINTLLLLILL